MSAVPRQLSAVDAQKAVAQTITVIEGAADARGNLLGEARIDNDRHLKALAQALKTMVEKLVPADAHKVFVQLIASIERPNHARQLDILAEALQAVPGELAPADAQRAFTQLITIIERTTNPYQLEALAKAYGRCQASSHPRMRSGCLPKPLLPSIRPPISGSLMHWAGH